VKQPSLLPDKPTSAHACAVFSYLLHREYSLQENPTSLHGPDAWQTIGVGFIKKLFIPGRKTIKM